MSTILRFIVIAAGLAALPATAVAHGEQARAAAVPTYLELVSVGYDLLVEGKASDAYVAALAAHQQDPRRFEAYALASLVLHQRGEFADAKAFVARAILLAPPDRQPKLREFAAAIDEALASPGTQATPTPVDLTGTTWSGALKGSYTYERSAPKPLDATFTPAFATSGSGAASFNSSAQVMRWTQKGRYVSIEVVLKEYGCPATLTIRATMDGRRMNGAFSIRGEGCAPANGTWTATRTR